MVTVVIVEKVGTLSTQNISKIKLDNLYKKCKFRKKDNFEKRATWKYSGKYNPLYPRDVGKAGTENKYGPPPTIDKDLYFGSMLIIKHNNECPKDDEVENLTKEEWEKVYDKCMGGFEDLGVEDSFSDEEHIPDHLKTAQGYMKDGFVVDDNAEDEDDDDGDDDEFISEADESTEDDEEEDDEANYGGETEDEDDDEKDDDVEDDEPDEDDEKDDDVEDDEPDEDDEDDVTSELSEEEYEYK